ncbi:MAG: aminomethyl-transferring glycine dehydrogenase subunit GcvPA [Clostridiales bacterium]|nr:aminomethyl-transferring glycine dehydrogenase subunit GcvPA [Clostridiales bacterium]
MSYIPGTARERAEMLADTGCKSIDDLFSCVPESVRLKAPLNLPEAQTEFEVLSDIESIAAKNRQYKAIFRGAGAYNHFIPEVVKSLSSRSEFVTAYTPYQPEVSQGILQVIFEYQSVICRLTGMDVSNAGVYDGASAAAEAFAMCRERGRNKLITFSNIKPQVLSVLKTYACSAGAKVEVIACVDGLADLGALGCALDDTAACVYIEQPNYYGLIENAQDIASLVHEKKAKLIMGCEPVSLALLKTPAEYGADIAVGEAQGLGLELSFGGPYLGYMASTTANMRKLPGRIVGKTTDSEGRDAYVLTLQAREQHIRREKASSSICSNEALCALTATIYCAAVGREGLIEVASQSYSKAHYAAKLFSAIPGFGLRFSGEFFNEFITDCPCDAKKIMSALAERSILGGKILDCGRILWCVTEVNTKAQIDEVASILKEVTAV